MKMWNRILLLIVAFLVSEAVCAQGQQQDLQPVQVIWRCGGESVTISEAKDDGVAVAQPNSGGLPYANSNAKAVNPISIECLYKASDLESVYPDGAEYEVKWYYYMSTRRMLMSTKIVSVKAADANKDGFVVLSCLGKSNPRSGWWEVQIRDKQSGDVVVFADQDTYQILLK